MKDKEKRKCPLCSMPLSMRHIKDKDDPLVRGLPQEEISPPYVLVYHAFYKSCDYVELLKY